MKSLDRKEAARLTRCRQVFHAWCQFHLLMRQGQEGGHLAAPFLIRNPTGLVSERLGTRSETSPACTEARMANTASVSTLMRG